MHFKFVAVVFLVACLELVLGQAEICTNYCKTFLYRDVKIAEKRCRFYFERQTWADALKTCDLDKGTLIKIRSHEENQELHKILKDDIWDKGSHEKINNRTMQGYIWLGGSDQEHEGMFKWYPEKEDFRFTAWSGPNNGDWAQPDNYENEEHCVEVASVSSKTLYWNDAPCWEKKRFICEYPLRTVN